MDAVFIILHFSCDRTNMHHYPPVVESLCFITSECIIVFHTHIHTHIYALCTCIYALTMQKQIQIPWIYTKFCSAVFGLGIILRNVMIYLNLFFQLASLALGHPIAWSPECQWLSDLAKINRHWTTPNHDLERPVYIYFGGALFVFRQNNAWEKNNFVSVIRRLYWYL